VVIAIRINTRVNNAAVCFAQGDHIVRTGQTRVMSIKIKTAVTIDISGFIVAGLITMHQ
jgi:hypothetical protein